MNVVTKNSDGTTTTSAPPAAYFSPFSPPGGPISATSLSQQQAPAPIPTPPVPSNISAPIAGGNAMLAANSLSLTPPTTATPTDSTPDYFKQFQQAQAQAQDQYQQNSGNNLYNADYNTSPVAADQAQAIIDRQAYQTATNTVNNLQAQIQALDYQGNVVNPVQSQQDATGRGITAAGLAPIDAAAQRQILLQKAPLQMQALQAQSAQALALGNAQLSQQILQQAQQHLDTVFQIHQQDAQAQYQYQTNLVNQVYQYADKQQQAQLDAAKTKASQDFQTQQNALKTANDYANTALASGQSALAGKIIALDSKSPTYQSDVAKLAGQIAPKSTTTPSLPTSPTNYVPGANPAVDAWAERIYNSQAKITDIPASDPGLRNAVTVALQSLGNSLSGGPTVTELGVAAKTTAQDLLDKFNSNQGWIGNSSPVGLNGILGTIPGTSSRNFVVDFNTLKSQLSLDAVKYLKGQGQVSDSERALLASAVTKLNLSQSPGEFKKTLQGIIDKLNGTPTTTAPTTVTAPDGTQIQITD